MSKWHKWNNNDSNNNVSMTYYRFKQKCARKFIVSFVFLGLIFGFISSSFSRTRVQSGETGESTLDTHNIDIDPVDLDKSIIIFQFRTYHADLGSGKVQYPRDHAWAAKFNSNSQIQIHRDPSGTAAIDHVWYVIESDAFQVEYVEVHFNEDELSKTVNLTNLTPNGNPVNFIPGKSFVVGRVTNFASSSATSMNAIYFDYELLFDENGETNDKLVITRDVANTGNDTAACDVWLFVVRLHDDSTVYSGNIADWTYEEVLAVDDLHDNSGSSVNVDRTKSWLTFGKRNTYSALRAENSGNINSDTTVGFKRLEIDAKAGTTNLHYWVHELGTLGRVEAGQVLIQKNVEWYKDKTLSQPFDVTRSFAVSTQNSTGGGTYYHRVRHTIKFINNGADLRLERGEPGQNAICEFFAVELEPMRLFTPNGGELWVAGETYDITWYAPDQIQNVEILLSNDGGASYPVQVVASTPNDGLFEWTIGNDPGVIGNQMRIKVRDVNWNEMGRTDDRWSSDVSDADFEIIGKLELTYPAGGEEIVYEDPLTITWNFYGDTGSRTAAIKYSTDSGVTYPNTIATGVNIGDGSYSLDWDTTPLPLSNQLRIRIEQEGEESRVYDESDANFTVKGQITLTAPTGGETWDIGTSKDISWTVKGGSFMTSGVDIKLSRNSGGTYDSVIASGVAADAGSQSWTVQAPASTQARVKVQSIDYPDVYDESGSDFTIRAVLTLNTPSGTGIVWRVGESHDIEWTTNGTVSTVDLLYDTGSGYTAITPPQGITNSSPYSWTIPDDISDTVKVKVQNHDDTNIYDESDNFFKIKGKVTVSEPHAGEVLHVGEMKVIQWDLGGTVTGTANIRLSKDGGTSYGSPLASPDITTKSYNWTPTSADIGINNVIKVGLQGDEDINTGTAGASGVFSVEADLTLDYPNETGLSFNVGDTIYIKWTPNPTDFGSVNIRYDTNSGNGADGVPDSGDEYQGFIADGVASDNIPSGESEYGYKWTIPDVPGIVSPNCRIKIYQVGKESAVHAESQYDFSIKGTITLTGEANGEGNPVWEVGTNKEITWTAVGDITPVNIYYTLTGAEPYDQTVVTDYAAGSGAQSYLWQPIPNNAIPSDRNTNIKFKVVSVNDPTIYGVSANPITIQGKLVISSPNGLETLYVDNPDDSGDSYNISWTTYGNISQVKLAYDTNSGLGPDGLADTGDEYQNAIAGGQALTNVDGYSWEVPNAIGDKVRVKVMSAAFPNDIYDTSNADFTIKGKIVIISPNSSVTGAGAWRVNSASMPSTQNIQWRNCGDLQDGTVTIKHAGDGVNFNTTITTTASGSNGPQSFNWTIPDSIGATNKIKIIDNDTVLPADDAISEAFEIKGQIDISVPDGGEIYYIGGSPIPVEWDYAGSLGNIDIYFSSDGGTNWESSPRATIPVDTSQPYNLDVPNIPTTQGKLKLVQVSDTSVSSATLDPGFAIKGNVTLTYPKDEPALVKQVGEDLTIQWSITGAIANVAIDYDKNSGNDGYLGVITSSTNASAGSYTWTIPSDNSAVSDHVRIRVRDASDSSVSDESTSDFKIKPIIEVTSPSGGEEWIVGELQTISWTPTGFASGEQVKIEYSDDGGNTFPGTGDYIINSSISASALNYDWSIPTTVVLSSQCVVRISKVGDVETYDDSNWFTLKGKVDITDPDGGKNLPINNIYTVKWNITGNVGNVALYYSVDAAHNNWSQCLDSSDTPIEVPASNGQADWKIPDAPSTTVAVKLVPTTSGDPTDQNISDGDNAIIGSIFIQTPDPTNGDTMVVDSSYTVSWTKFGSITAYDVYYSYDGKQNWSQIADDITSTSFSWTVEDHISSEVHFKVVDASNPDVYDETEGASTIKGSIDLTDPDGAETLVVGEPFDITWTKHGSIGNIKIEYSTDDFTSDIRTINASYPSDSSPYSWSPGVDDITNADTVKVRVTSIGGISVSDTSQNPFKIVGKIYNVQPSGSTVVWHPSESKTISWNQSGNISAVDIKYKTASADPFNKVIVTNDTGHADGANTYQCTVPDENSEDVWIRIYDHANTDVYGTSAAAFSIRPVITVTSPAAGARLEVGTSKPYTVDWSVNGSAKVNPVDIAYSTSGAGGPFDQPIASGVDSTLGTVSWSTVSDTISDNCYVRVIDTVNSNVYGLSGGGTSPFSIVGTITVQTPNGDEDWPVGSSQTISWTKTGTIGDVKIEADYDGDGTYDELLGTVDSDISTSFTWNPVPDQVTNNAKIKVTDVSDTQVYDESDSPFHIIGSFNITAPDGSPLTSGDPYTIQWTSTGTAINKVKLEFYDGSTWSTIDNLAPNSGSYSWTVPSNTNSTNCKIKITASDPDQPATATESSTFWVHGKIDVTSPTSGDKWTVGTSQDITFNITGKIDNVNILYSKDGGTNYTYTIISGLAVTSGANTHAWTIPTDQDILSYDQAKIKVVDAAYSTVYGESDDFMLKGSITVLTPSADNIILTYGSPTPYDITWSYSGPIQKVRIFYSTNDGTTYPNEITNPTTGVPASDLSYAWDVPDIIMGKHLKIKIVDFDNTTDCFDESDNSFEIIGQLQLTSPTGGETWAVGTDQAVSWNSTGTFDNVHIEASTDDFTTTILDVTRPRTDGSYTWTIPDNISDTVKVKISDPDHHPELAQDVSPNFSIIGGLDVTVPESGQVWYVGESKTISWNATGTVTNVKIEYKTSSGGAYYTIVADDSGHTSGANSYVWSSVADENSEDCYIKISDVNKPTLVYSVSEAPFSIRPKITISSPSAGELVRVGSTYVDKIQWSLNGSTKVTTVDILYSTNGPAGPFDKTIATGIDASLGKYDWTNVADTISDNVVIKVVDTSNSNVYGLSGVFSIIGDITVQAPNGDEDWPVGSSQNITWTKKGTIGNVNIYVDYDGDGTYDELLGTVDSETSTLFNWSPIPDNVTNNAKIKVADADNESNVYDESDSPFHIAAAFTITSPGDGNVLTVDENWDILWSRLGSAVTEVKLEYSSNGGADWVLITDSATNSGTYPWTVPDAITTSGKVKISDPNNLNAYAVSDGYFKIQGSLKVTSPNSGTESWNVGSTYPITWTKHGSIATINIFYSHDNGTSWTQLNTVAVDASLLSWDWTIDESIPISTQALIKIVDTSDSTVDDISDNNFEVKGTLHLTAPSDSGISLSVGDNYSITWEKYGAVGNIDIHYSTDGGIAGGGAYPEGNLIATVPATDLSLNWSVPDEIGTNLRIRIRAVNNYNVWDESDNPFQIQGKVTLNNPLGGEVFYVGDTEPIKWTPTGTYAQVKLEYSTNGFADELETHTIATVLAGDSGVMQSYDWTIPDAIGSNLKVRVSDNNNPQVFDISSNPFTIKGKLRLITPDGGEEWIVASVHNITWQRTGSIANVKLEYSTDGGGTYPNEIVASTDASTGSYSWTIPEVISSNLKVRISDVSDFSVFDVSDGTFTTKGALHLTAPNGGEAWQVSNPYNITWERTGPIQYVELRYSLDGGMTYPGIISDQADASAESFTWTIPDNPCTTVKVKITDTTDSSVFDISDANFKIVGALTVISPDGGEKWKVGESRKITWSMVGSIANVKLEYSKNSGTSYDYLIIESTPGGALEYYWDIPDDVTTTCRIKISDASDATVYDTSNGDFKIQAVFDVATPDGGEVWEVGEAQDITWTCNATTVANVKLEYSSDGGSNWNTIIDSTPNTGVYSWSIPDDISSNCKVRVSDVNDSEAFDTTLGVFKIRGSLDLTSPDGGETLIVDSQHYITWTKNGSIEFIKLEYSTDSGLTYPNTITPSYDVSLGSFNWTIPDDISNTVRVKITDTSDGTVFDASNNDFFIKGALHLTSPNGTEEWVVGTAENITWERTGSIATVKLEYSTNSGVTFPYLIVSSTDASTGYYGWDIPDAISNTVRVKVSDASDSTVYDTSDSDFVIKGALTLNAPNGGQILYVGDAYSITWTRTGSIPTVKLEYSTNSGSSYDYLIVSSTDASTGAYTWTVPDAIGNQLRVKVTDTSNSTVFDTSDTDFTIKGKLKLNSPNGGETWIVGDAQEITWTPTGTINNVKLEYSTDGGNTYSYTIADSTPGMVGSYTWTIPDAIDNDLKVRVSDANDPSVNDESDAVFEIKGSLKVLTPNGGEQWGVGETHNISWDKTGSISTLTIRYSTDGGQTFPNVISSTADAATGSFTWTIPDDLSTTCKVKIINNADSSVFDTSDTNFKIVGILTVTSPNGGERWGVETNHNITWTLVGSIANVRLDYSTDGGASFPNTIVSSTPAGALSFTWTIPDSVSKTCRVRISDASDISVYDISDSDFTINARFDITSPDGGEVWIVDSSHNITWDTIGSVTTVRLDYSTDGGTNFNYNITSSTSNTGSFPWTIPQVISSQVRVKASDYNDPDSFAISDSNFKIRGDIEVISPDGGEAWIVGTTHDITWNITGPITEVNIDYSTDGGSTYPYPVASGVDASLGVYSWTIPDTLSKICKVRITDASDSTVYDESDNDFKIRGDLLLTTPNGGEIWEVDSIHNITWNLAGSIANVKLEYSTDGGNSFPYVIVSSFNAANGSYPWQVPDAISNQVKVRISDATDSSVFDISDSDFKIQGVITVTSPNGGEQWEVASTHNITWAITGSISNVKLDYTIDDGLDGYPYNISPNVNASLGSYSWDIPDSISNEVKIKITNLSDEDVYDTSDSTFKIIGKLVLTSPNGGEVWAVGSSQAVTWSAVGSIANVKLDYSTNGGVTYNYPIIASTPASSGSYNWTVPDAISQTVRVKVSDVDDPSNVYDTSDGNFKIRGNFVLTSPNGGEVWLISSSHDITWTRFGSIANAKLEYSIDSGATYPYTIVGSVDASQEFYSWVIPDTPSVQVKVKVSDASDSTVYDTSDGNFIIRGGFVITSPNGGEAWAVGSTHNITWTTFGSIATVKLDYSIDNGAHWNIIIGSTSNTGIYAWDIPDAISSECIVRVADTNDPDANDVSDSVFKIHGLISVTSPNGGEEWGVGSTQNITWDITGSIANVKLEYSSDGGANYTLIDSQVTASTGSYSWTIPDAITNNAYVKISDSSDDSVFDVSDAAFKIKASFTLTSPKGGETWIVDDVHNITWETYGTVTNVKLEYSSDEGNNWILIVDSTSNSGTYPWTVPNSISNQCRVRVSDVNDSSANDISDSNFKIRGNLIITSPNGGEKWAVGTNQVINWDRVGSISYVVLEYSDNGGTTFIPISLQSPNTGSYSWTVPDAITTQALVKITDYNDATVTDTSDNFFKIQGSFTVTSPNGGETWIVGESRNITWDSSGSVNYVALYYSTDSGSSWVSIESSVPNTGSYTWTVPDAVSGNVRIKVADASDAEASDTSNFDFRIRCSFNLTAPSGGEEWKVGQSYDITWISNGTIPEVKLEYSQDDFLTDINLISGDALNTGVYSWTIPNAISNTVKVRISDPNDSGAKDVSSDNFRIIAYFEIISPNGGQKWKVNSAQDITWNWQGTVPQVKLEYSSNGGATYNLIAAPNNTGSYTWTVPDDITDLFKVRVSDLADSSAYDESDDNNKIIADFTLTSPNGGEELTVGEDYTVSWSCVGTVDNVRLDYSKDSGLTFDYAIVSSTPNTGSYIWKVPNAPPQGESRIETIRVRVMSATDSDAFDASDSDCSIVRGILHITSPNGGERWVTREEHNITWETTQGSIPLVNIEYSKDNFNTDLHTIVSSYDNTISPNSYAWTIPDDRSTTVKVRVSDIRDVTVNDTSDDNFIIDYYSVTFNIRDLLTNENLSQLTVDGSSDKGDVWQTSEMPGNPGAPLGSPCTVELPYGFWTLVWSKTGYGDKQISFLLDRDEPLVGTENETIFMETTAIHIWRAYSDFAYDPTTDTLSVSSWLERDGFVVSGGIQADVYIYDPETEQEIAHLVDTSPDPAGFFSSIWNPTTLIAGKVYTTITDITNASGAHFKTPDSFTITAETKLQDVQDTVNAVLDKPISEVNAEIQQTLQDQTDLIDQKMEEQKTIIETKTDEMVSAVDETLTSFEERTTEAIEQLQAGAEQAVAAGEELEATAKKYSWKATVSPNPALSGEAITLQVQGPSGLYPMVNIYSWDNQSIVKDWVMTETTPGLYIFEFNADTRFTPGKAYTYTVSEQTTGGLVTGSGSVEEMSITTIAGLASAAPEAERAAKKTLDLVKALEATIGSEDGVSIAITLKNLQESVEELPSIIANQGASPIVTSTLNEITDKLTELAAGQGYDISEILEEKLSESPTIKAIRKKTDTIEGVLRILQALFEAKFGGMDAPIVSTVLQ